MAACVFCFVAELNLGVLDAAAPIGPHAREKTLTANLNGLELTLDLQTGSILGLAADGPGKCLGETPENASILDLAYPIPDFEPLRLASRYSKGAKVHAAGQEVTIHWDRLGPSRDFDTPGGVSATVRIRAADDARSTVFQCEIENQSEIAVRQVLFPDLVGLLPVAGQEGTEFVGAGTRMKPFVKLKTSKLDRFYATNDSTAVLRTGDLNDSQLVVGWMDYGSCGGGFSLFPKRWGWAPRPRVILHLSDATHRLRLSNEQTTEIPPGGKWKSCEFWLTPHRNGWAKGIEPFRKYARKQMKRDFTVPEHVTNGLGFRSVWMCQNQPKDPKDAVWKFKDLVPLAKEAKEYGLEEMVIWIWNQSFTLPLPPPYPHLGTEQELVAAIQSSKQMGVNIAPFISVLQAKKETADRYGFKITPGSGNWTYHNEFMPRFNPPYASGYACTQVDTTNVKWQADLFTSCEALIRKGMTSISWDQFWSVPKEPNLVTLTRRLRELARKADPLSTFSGEELRNWEIDSSILDYTWNWGQHENLEPLINVFPYPRVNLNINDSVEAVQRGFAGNLYLNVWPMKPESPNGSDWIANHPEMGDAVKQCAALRARFLDYFTRGTLIGDCLLVKPCPEARVDSYVLPDRILTLVVGTKAGHPVTLKMDAAPWLHSKTGKYRLSRFDSAGVEGTRENLGIGIQAIRIDPAKDHEIHLFTLKPLERIQSNPIQ